MTPSRIHSSIAPRGPAGKGITPFVFGMDAVAEVYPHLQEQFGISISPAMIRRMMAYGMDTDVQPNITVSSIATPVQFLQNWLPGFVAIITAARKIDDLVGMMTAGSWEDEEIVQGIKELLGTSVPYGDYTNVPLSSWNLAFERRTVIRFEEGMRAGILEEKRAARVQINSSAEKRTAAAEALEIQRNRVGFYGFNGGNNRTYGYLNDPNLPAATVFPNGATSGTPQWAGKTFNEITKDIISMATDLRVQSQDTIDPYKTPITMAVATAAVDALATQNSLGSQSVKQWLAETYPNVRVESAPELDAAISSDNAVYFYAESTQDGASTDDKRTWVQVVPSKFMTLGVQQMAKYYLEDYSNATAGVMLKRPFAVVRRYGA